ncbi:MAG: hypothetical protein ABI592_13805 [Acidobacteriota bacterium]
MKRSFLWMALVLAATPGFTWLVYRLARGLGFLDPPRDREQELRRTIVVALYALLLFLPVIFYGFEKRWPPAWVIFGSLVGLVLVVFAAAGVWSASRLWRIRHPAPPAGGPAHTDPVDGSLAATPVRVDAGAEPKAGAEPPAGL